MDGFGLAMLSHATHTLATLGLRKLRKLEFVLSQEQLPFEMEPDAELDIASLLPASSSPASGAGTEGAGALEVVCVELVPSGSERVRPKSVPLKDVGLKVTGALREVVDQYNQVTVSVCGRA